MVLGGGITGVGLARGIWVAFIEGLAKWMGWKLAWMPGGMGGIGPIEGRLGSRTTVGGGGGGGPADDMHV